MSDIEDDPYAVSSDSSDEDAEKTKKPPPKIQIEGRSNADLKQIVCFFKNFRTDDTNIFYLKFNGYQECF